MLDLSETQLYLLRKNHKDVVWLFDVTDKNDKSFHWSTRDYVYNSTEYSFNVTNFSGISLSRSKSEENIIAPSEVEIEIGNVGNTYSAENFVDGSVLISLLIDDTLIAKWKFNVIEAYGGYQTITLKCEDFLQKYLEGAYPNTQYVKALFPDVYYEDEDLCVPVCFGTAYIPLRPVEIEGDRYYLLGPTDRTYTIEEVHAPSEWGIKQTWSSADYSFNQYTKTDQFGNSWRVFQPIIADSDLDGTADACGVWISGQKILDMPTKFSYNSTTNPADVIKTILKDFGVPDSEIDDDSFSSAASTFDSWGLEWNGGLWTKSDRRFILATLLNMCHSRILVRDKLVLSVLSNEVQKNITSAVVSKESFDYTKLTEELSDSGYVAWQKEGEPQDNMLKALVPGKNTTTNYISDETIFIPWVQDAVHVQKLACLAFQRKFFKVAQVSFKGRSELLVLEPGDIVRVIGSNYGGMYNVIVDNVKINPDLVIEISATRHSIDFDDWNSLTQFSYITIYTTVPSAWEALPSGYGYGIRWDRDQATLLVEGTIRVTGGFIADAGGFIRSGQTGFNQGTGFWIGNDAGTPKLSIGCSTGKRITWDGTTLTIKGDLKFDDYNYWEVGGDFRVGAAEHYILWNSTSAELTIKGKLTLDTHNYWYPEPNVEFRVGSASKYMYWNGSSLEIRGDSNNYWDLGGDFRVGSSGQRMTWDGSTLYFQGEGHFGDGSDYVLIQPSGSYVGQIQMYTDGLLRVRLMALSNQLDVLIPSSSVFRFGSAEHVTWKDIVPGLNEGANLGKSSAKFNFLYVKQIGESGYSVSDLYVTFVHFTNFTTASKTAQNEWVEVKVNGTTRWLRLYA